MELNLDRLIWIVRRWGVWLVVLTLVGVLSGALLSFTRPVQYASTTTLLLNPFSATDPIFGYDVNQALQSQAETYRYLLGTTPFLTQVAAQLGLDPVMGVQQLQAATSVVTSQAVPTITITVTSTDAETTSLWANAMAESFVTYSSSVVQPTTGDGGNWVTLTIPEPATAEGAPVSPSRPLWAVLGGLFGFLIVATVILLLEHMRSMLPAVNRNLAALPVLSVIDQIKQRAFGPGMLVDTKGGSEAARGVNQLRSAVQILTATRGIRTMAVSSLRPGEGKSTVAANLAVALAEAGDRVILIDANLEAPHLSEIFGGRTARGLTSLMRDPDLDLADVVTSTNWANLMFIPAGPRVDDDQIDRLAFRRTLAQVIPHADLVIYESQTLIGSSERLRLGSYADGMLLVVGGDRTRIEALRSISREKVISDGNVVGVVIDRGAGTVLVPLPPSPTGTPNSAGLTLVGGAPNQVPSLAEQTPRHQPAMASADTASASDANGMVRTQRAMPVTDPNPAETQPGGASRPEATA